MGLKIVNGAWGTLASGIAAGDLTINLTAGHGTRLGSFSAGDYMYATLIKGSSNQTEYIKITARSTDALTVVRGLDGSTAIDFNAGDRIECRPANAAVRAAVQELGAIEMAGTNTYTGTLDPVPTGYNTRQLYLLGFANTNSASAPTVNLNTLGAKTIKKPGGGSLANGDLPRWGMLFYDGTDMILVNATSSPELAYIEVGSAAPAFSPAAGGTSAVAIGDGASASGAYAGVLAGSSSVASGNWSVTLGGRLLNSKRKGQITFGCPSVSQVGHGSSVSAETATTDATPTELRINGADPVYVYSNSVVAFRILVAARRIDVGGEGAGYEFSGVIQNNAGTTALIGSVTKAVLGESSSAWDCNVTADNANDAITITVTGEAGKTIRWCARVDMCEVGAGAS